ncbi:S9 family peptidase [Virgibacillus sp. SK37]|uniref:S9 family peptidase n=1 Tax=Virgibacillus sp. SK37 TaxID=403957 RepID=UPI0004D16A20|nr:S9 family peptidase [Virgibacillus sp. SK37]AIF42646.1 peptidase [Virgibacillus sp. SK37]
MNEKRSLKTEDLLEYEIVSDPKFTPYGNAYTYVSTTINEKKEYESHLFSQSLDSKDRHQWTFGKEKSNNIYVSPDGKKAVFQSNRSGTEQLWLLPMQGGEAQQLTKLKHGASNPVWGPDSNTLIFNASIDPAEDSNNLSEISKEEKDKEQKELAKRPLVINRLKYKSDAKGFHDQKRTQLFALDIETGNLEQLTSAHTDHILQDVSPDGNEILFIANLGENEDYEQVDDIYILNRFSKKIKKLTDSKGTYHRAVYAPVGNKIAAFGHSFTYAGATLTDLYIFDPVSHEKSILSAEWDIQLGDAMIGDTRLGNSESGPIWATDGESIFFLATDHGVTGLYQVSLTGELDVLYKENHHVFGFTYDAHSGSFILGISTPTNPCNFYHLKKDGEIHRLTDFNSALLSKLTLAEPETITVPTKDGEEIQGWLLPPSGYQDGEKYPMILEIHGGPHAMYGQTYFHELQLLAAKGYVVVYANPRGSHGYGQEFVNACRTDYGNGDYTDLMEVVDYVLANFDFIDKDRLGVTGGSYGGFMTNWIVGHTNRFKAAVTQRSISNWLSFYGVSDIGFFFNEWEHGLNLLDDPKKLWDISPLKYAKNVETPLLILHGEKDFRCPVEQGEQLFITLKHLRKEVEFVRFPDANHELSRSGKPEMRIERLNHICRWFEKL